MAPVQVAPLAPHLAAAMLAGLERYAPRGMASAREVEAMCARGLCFAANIGGESQAVYVLQMRERQAWISACAGRGPADLTRALLGGIELQVAGACDSVGFLTARRGLVKKAQEQGYEIRGWVLGKDLPKWT